MAIIMDGNGRWAKKRHLPRSRGHHEGVKRVGDIVDVAEAMGIKALTLYAFSTENWNRPKQEISILMKLFISSLDKKIDKLNKNNIHLRFIGSRSGVPSQVLEAMDKASGLMRNNTGMMLNIAFNYGSRFEILNAVKKIACEVKSNKITLDDITEETFSKALYTCELPDPDLLIRTSGERRISNFLLWQLSYAELYFTEKFWPDFTASEFEKAIQDFKNRERRYGKTSAAKG